LITLGAKNLYELIANAPGDEITLKKADSHWAEIKSGKLACRIVGMLDRDFPKVPDPPAAAARDLPPPRRPPGAASTTRRPARPWYTPRHRGNGSDRVGPRDEIAVRTLVARAPDRTSFMYDSTSPPRPAPSPRRRSGSGRRAARADECERRAAGLSCARSPPQRTPKTPPA
jgi:hypothetical protein